MARTATKKRAKPTDVPVVARARRLIAAVNDNGPLYVRSLVAQARAIGIRNAIYYSTCVGHIDESAIQDVRLLALLNEYKKSRPDAEDPHEATREFATFLAKRGYVMLRSTRGLFDIDP